jgi:hypothetical protein
MKSPSRLPRASMMLIQCAYATLRMTVIPPILSGQRTGEGILTGIGFSFTPNRRCTPSLSPFLVYLSFLFLFRRFLFFIFFANNELRAHFDISAKKTVQKNTA